MLKSQLVEHLLNNIKQYGDGEITIELTEDFSEEGVFYQIEDVINTSGGYDSILVFKDTEFMR